MSDVLADLDRWIAEGTVPPQLKRARDELARLHRLELQRGALHRLDQKDPASVVAISEIVSERLRQIEAEDHRPADDDVHRADDIAHAAACYLVAQHTPPAGTAEQPPNMWPWAAAWWKPKSSHRNKVRAGALVIAELARMYRTGGKPDV